MNQPTCDDTLNYDKLHEMLGKILALGVPVGTLYMASDVYVFLRNYLLFNCFVKPDLTEQIDFTYYGIRCLPNPALAKGDICMEVTLKGRSEPSILRWNVSHDSFIEEIYNKLRSPILARDCLV